MEKLKDIERDLRAAEKKWADYIFGASDCDPLLLELEVQILRMEYEKEFHRILASLGCIIEKKFL